MSEPQHSARFSAGHDHATHAARAGVWLCMGVLACVWLAACGTGEPCAVPGVAEACACANQAPGARVCSAERTLGVCDCSGAIGLPNAVADNPGTSGTGAAAGKGGASGTGSAGTGMPMHRDAGVPDASASTDAGDAAQNMDSGPDPDLAYRACMSATDCDPGAQCTVTMTGTTNVTVCQPACVDTTDCPVPSGTYGAVVKCVSGFCAFDCTPLLAQPLLSCPTGMTCVPFFGFAACYGG